MLEFLLEALDWEEDFLVGSLVLESLLEVLEREGFLGGSSFSTDAFERLFDLVFLTFSIMLSVFKWSVLFQGFLRHKAGILGLVELVKSFAISSFSTVVSSFSAVVSSFSTVVSSFSAVVSSFSRLILILALVPLDSAIFFVFLIHYQY